MKLDLRELLAEKCRVLPIHYTIDPAAWSTDDPKSALCGVRFPSPMEVNGEIVNTAGYMRMCLNLSLDYVAPCARCLAETAGKFSFSLEKTVAPKNVLEGLDEDALDDYAVVENGFLDMDEPLLELLEIEFPRRILCREDCRGLCPKCGKDLNEGPCSCGADPDPRWAPLQAILDEMEAEKNDK
ncbi:MAG: DUF177 domain-containing protein [Clostridia bacterium]|nr:DUF177 domain-containing protein [Clostridia bacterium]MDY6185011.1 DUF177 domain-containing protein [Eubacteriales bacterium]